MRGSLYHPIAREDHHRGIGCGSQADLVRPDGPPGVHMKIHREINKRMPYDQPALGRGSVVNEV